MDARMTGTRFLRADREAVWAALNDAASLRRCVPGCRTLEKVSNDLFALTVEVGLGPVRTVFGGTVTVTCSDAGRGMTLVAMGEGGVVGRALGTTRLTLTPDADGCRLTYDIEAKATGPLAALGAMFLTALAKALTYQFLVSLASGLAAAPRPSPGQGQAGRKSPAISSSV